MSRSNDRHAKRDLELQSRLLIGLHEDRSATRTAIEASIAGADVAWQLTDLIKRGYVRQPGDTGHVELTSVGRKAAENGLNLQTTTRRSSVTDEELGRLHVLMWESASSLTDAEGRRDHTEGVKWLMEEHLGVETSDGGGPHGKARRDALQRMEDAGLIERVGGGKAQQTNRCWVTPPEPTASNRQLRAFLRKSITEDTNPGDWLTFPAVMARYGDDAADLLSAGVDLDAAIRAELDVLCTEGVLEAQDDGGYRRW